jgi:pimeloyl-ACP methyl ester carboxylesterase
METSSVTTGMVFVHGSLSNASQWKDMLGMLPPELRRECPNLVGYARDASFDPRLYSLDDEVDLVVASLDRIDAPAILVGHSFGGMASIGAALRRPELIAGLVLIEPVAFQLLDAPATADDFLCALAFCDDVRALIGAGKPLDAAERFFSFWELGRLWDSFDATRKNRVAQMMNKVAAECTLIRRPGVTPQEISAGLRMPVLLLQGALSPAFMHKLTRVLSACLPHAEYRVLLTGNHLSPVMQPREVMRHIHEFVNAPQVRH